LGVEISCKECSNVLFDGVPKDMIFGILGLRITEGVIIDFY